MPHKCVRCGRVYPNNSSGLLKECGCGARIFLYLQAGEVSLAEAMDSGLEAVIGSGRVQELSKAAPVSIEIAAPEGTSPDNAPASGTGEGGKENPAALEAQDAAGLAQETKNGFGAGAQSGRARESPAENITIIEKGEYEIDIASIMRGDPLVVRSQNGIYYLKIPTLKRKE
jgi:predicted  nucleic acid-binding Zn-ribbon protein